VPKQAFRSVYFRHVNKPEILLAYECIEIMAQRGQRYYWYMEVSKSGVCSLKIDPRQISVWSCLSNPTSATGNLPLPSCRVETLCLKNFPSDLVPVHSQIQGHRLGVSNGETSLRRDVVTNKGRK
jgi:hypothetical protein